MTFSKKALLLLGMILLPVAAGAHPGPPAVVGVRTYRAPTTARALEIDPQELHGCGAADYRMRLGVADVWQARLPFTLCEAVVTDDGVTAGYGYSHGLEGWGVGRPGTLDVVILDASGKVRLHEAIKRQESRFPDGQPEPMAAGVLVHAAADRFIVRIHSDSGEEWRNYRLSTGERLQPFDLRAASGAPQAARFVMSARELGGSPLTLVNWWLYDGENKKCGALFHLCGLDGRAVWTLKLPDDYSLPGHGEEEEVLQSDVRKEGSVLDTSEQGAFELRFVKAGERVRFEVQPDASSPNGWRVTEPARSKYQPPPPAGKRAVEKKALPLRRLGSFTLKGTVPQGAVHDLWDFAFDGEGHAGLLQRDDDGETFVLADASGKELTKMPLALDLGQGLPHLRWLTGSRWILVAGIEHARAWWLDVKQGTVSEVASFACPEADAISPVPDGGFVVLGTARQKYSSHSEMLRFDAAGKRLWRHVLKDDGKPGSLLSPEGLAVIGGKEIAVVDVIRHIVQIFGLDGSWLRKIELNKAWGREPRYPSGLFTDKEGGFIVHDFQGQPPFVRMGADGGMKGGFAPHLADGRAMEVHRVLRVAPDGSVWAGDGHCLAQLSDAGEAKRFIGLPPDVDRLEKISAIAGDGQGHVYAVDERTMAVHVFDSQGAKVRMCKPAPADFGAVFFSPQVTAADDGCVFLAQGDGDGPPRELCFDANGRRTGIRRLDVDNVSQEWHAQPGTTNLLVLGYEKAFLVSREGKVLRTIERLPDRGWLEHPRGAALAADGSFAMGSERHEGGTGKVVSFFTSKGEPISSFETELASLGWEMRGFNGTYVTLSDGKEVMVRDRKGTLINSQPGPGPNGWDHFLTRGGTELWIVDFTTRQVDRYAMPGRDEGTP